MPTPIADLKEEIEAEKGARDSYEPNTLPHEYHDGGSMGCDGCWNISTVSMAFNRNILQLTFRLTYLSLMW